MLAYVEFCDLSRGTWLLRAELIAREEKEPQAGIGVLAPKRDEPGHLLHVSQTGHVHHKHELARECVERDLLAGVVPGTQFRKRALNVWLSSPLRIVFHASVSLCERVCCFYARPTLSS